MIAVMSNIEDFLTTTGQRVRFARDRIKGWQSKELASRAKISPAMLSKIEHDQKNPSMETLIALARELDVSIDWLVPSQGAENPYRRKEDEPVYFSQEADEVARLVDDLPPKYRAVVLAQAQSIRSKFEAENQEYNALIKLIGEVAGANVARQIERRLMPPGEVPAGDGTTLHVLSNDVGGNVAEATQYSRPLLWRELAE